METVSLRPNGGVVWPSRVPPLVPSRAVSRPPPHRPYEKKQRDYKTKVSLGVACCRFMDGRPEILMVLKRYTYYYNAFVHGKYGTNNRQVLMNLFNGMTVDEKQDILSLNFNQIWYRVWLHAPKNSSYFMSKNKFESSFLPDGGRRLRAMISASTTSSCIWEIPKGHKNSGREPDVNCAVREFNEETSFDKTNYKLIPGAIRRHSYIDDNVRYSNIYYIGLANDFSDTPRINFFNKDQVGEISDIRWMSLEMVRLVDCNGRLEPVVKPIFNFLASQKRARQPARRGRSAPIPLERPMSKVDPVTRKVVRFADGH